MKNTKLIFASAMFIATILVNSVYSQEGESIVVVKDYDVKWTETDTSLKFSGHQVGLAAGFVSGVGLSYRYWPGKMGMQVTFVPITGDDNTFVSLGVGVLNKLKDNKMVDLFAYWGLHMLYHDVYVETQGDYNSQYDYSYEKEFMLNTGAGIGFGFSVFDVITFDIMFGYGIYDIMNDIRTNLTGEVAVYYRL